MGKLVKFFLFMAIILLFFATCDVFNAPLKEYIENATGRAAAGEWLFTTQSCEMANGITAIPPSDEAEYTKIIFGIDNPKKGSIKLEIEGDGSEFASVNLNNNGQASITIKNQKRGFIFDLSLNVYVNGRRMAPKKLPKMENRYFNNKIISLKVNSPPGSSGYPTVNYDPPAKKYWVELYSGAVNIEILVDIHQSSKYTINGQTNNKINITDNVTEFSIVVKADCELKETYTLIVYKNGYAPAITVTRNGKTTNHATLGSAYSSIGDSDNVVEIKVYKDISINEEVNLFKLNPTSPKQITLSTDVNDMGGVNIILGLQGSMFIINQNITLILGGGKGTLTLKGNDNNDSPLINVNGGALKLYEGAEIFKNTYIVGTGNGGGVSVINGTFTMNGGSIKENTAAIGGGVYVINGTFKIIRGSIEGNSAGNGGGVFVIDGRDFNMSGGSIKANTSMGNGGGVFVTNSTFKMDGGSIEDNELESFSTNRGGGIYVTSGTFNMNRGIIKGNRASNIPSGYSYGGGVFVTDSSTFTMDGGTIGGSGGISEEQNFAMYGGGVYLDSGTFNFTGGLIGNPNVDDYGPPTSPEMAGNYASANGGGVYNKDGDFLFEEKENHGKIMGNLADGLGGGLYHENIYTGPSGTDDLYYKDNSPQNVYPEL